MSAEANTVRPMLRMRRVEQRLGVHRATIHRWIGNGTFPAPIALGDNAVAFFEDEVAAWQKEREAAALRPPLELQPIKRRGGYRRPGR